jgi:serine/threonine protein kinase/formylglycine-generating enzyme required for sulfatase activity
LNDQSRRTEPSDPRVEAALRDYLERVDRGEPVDREKFLAGYPPIADALRSFIDAEDEVRKLAGAEVPLDGAHDSTKSFVAHGQETIAPQSVAKRSPESAGGGLTGQFGRYRIIRALGKGAMGTVYLAEDTQLKRSVAIKTPHFTESPTEELLERFYREARVAATLRQPHICPVFDVGQIDGKHYISMAYIEGRPLLAFIRPDKPQSERQILIVIRKLALALREAHDHGIVHRDLKPANIMVDKKGEPIIMDFGLAQQTQREGDIRLTQTGNIIGTPAYMSPEQVEGEPENIGPPTDQYSLGVILYEMLTAHLPFRGSIIAVMGQILTKPVPPPSQIRPDVDPRIEAVCLKMLAKKPSERFASLKAVADELAAILKSPAAKPNPEDGQGAPATQSSDQLRANAGASQALKSLKLKTLTESDLGSLEELARKCLARRDYDQVIQVIERIPDEKRSARLAALLNNARGKVDEIAFLICDLDEADRLNDRQRARKKAEELLTIKPGHHRALEVQEKYSGYGEGGAARIGVLDQFRRPLNDGGWIPWSALAFGLAVFGVVTGVIVIYLRGTAIVVEIQDPDVAVTVKGSDVVITGPKNEKVTVTPGDQELSITYAGLKLLTKSFTLQQGQKRTVTVSIVNKEIVARLENEILPLTSIDGEKTSSPTAGGKNPTPPPPFGKEVVTIPTVKQPVAALPGASAVGPQSNVGSTASKIFGRPFLGRGEWRIENDELVQPILAAGDESFPLLAFGDESLSNYDLTLETKKTGGRDALGIRFQWLGPGHYREFCLKGNGETNFAYRYNGNWGREDGNSKGLSYASNHWYPLKVEVRGDTFRVYFDGVLQFEQTDPRFMHGRICLYTWDAAARFRRIKVSDPQGNVLFEGLPELPPASNNTPSKADIGRTSRLLTAGETAAKSAQQEWAERLKTPVISTTSLGMKLALIPPGEFQMGSPESESQRNGNEQQHRVRITKPFYLGVYEITQSEFEQVMGRNPSAFSNGGGQAEAGTGVDTSRYPVESVTWYEAIEFCNKLSEKEGRQPYYRLTDVEREENGSIKKAQVNVEGGAGYRLPTEAQWEYACRAGTTTPFNSGTINNGSESNCNGKRPDGTEEQGPAVGSPVPVGSYRPNAWGLYDMPGNVWEWCWDAYDEAYYKNSAESETPPRTAKVSRKKSNTKNSAASDPAGPFGGPDRVMRGGSWLSLALECRAAHRGWNEPQHRYYDRGFRVARGEEQPDATLKSMTFAPNGGWAILYNDNGYLARNIPNEALSKLTELAKEGAALKSIAFAPNGGWAILYNENKYVAKNIPDEALKKLGQLAGEGHELRSLTFSPNGGWAILYDKHGYSIRHIPDEAFKKILELVKQDAELKSITFTPRDGWVILYNKNDYFTKKIPDAALKKLAEFAKKGAEVKSITFTPHDGWAILYNKNDYFTRKIPDDAFTKLGEAKHGAERKSTDVKPGI